jgi:uncharacterized membrane protein
MGCEKVEQSRYAWPLGIPMPLLGMAGYLALFITACLRGQRARTAGMVFTVCAIGMSLVLTYLEVNVIHALCYWCLSSAICATLHVVVNSARFVRGDPPAGAAQGATAAATISSMTRSGASAAASTP